MDGITRLDIPHDFSIAPGRVVYAQLSNKINIEQLSASCPALPDDIHSSIESRKIEFLAGRYCAAQALSALGADIHWVKRNDDRSPRWPEGTCGSLSHAEDRIIVCTGWKRDFHGIGIDIEKCITNELLPSLQTLVFTAREEKLVHEVDLPPLQAATLIFSAKESFYKCVYPQTHCQINFTDISLVAIEKGIFFAKVRKQIGEIWQKDAVVSGQYYFDDDYVITLTTLKT